MSGAYNTWITEDRYAGLYSGGKWLSFPCEFLAPRELNAFGGDTECGEFWLTPVSSRIGRGATPNEAYRDMLRRVES